jgi:hypothetical protein
MGKPAGLAGATASQKRIAHALAEAGATLVWGHHPHVLQPVEWINDGKTLRFTASEMHSLTSTVSSRYAGLHWWL